MLPSLLPTLRARAAAQGGAFTAAQARAAGLSPDQIRQRVRSGAWTALRRGLYAETALLAELDDAGRHALACWAAILRHHHGPVASHESAARLHHLERLGRWPNGVRLTRETGALVSARGLRVDLASLPRDHLGTACSVPATSAARTAVDLARSWPLLDAVVILDSSLRTGCPASELRRVLSDCVDWPGALAASRALRLADPFAESVLETVSRVQAHLAGLPSPGSQRTLWHRGAHLGRVDFWWGELGVAGEADGALKYGDRAALVAEKQRQERLERLGVVFARWGWADVHPDPARFLVIVQEAFARARRLRAAGIAAEVEVSRPR